jgi:CRISPR-associated protein Cmr6
MAQAAAPAYLGNDFSKAAPGHRFSLYFPIWVRGPWTREPDKQANKDGSPAAGKAPALRTMIALGKYFADLNRTLCERQAALAAPIEAQGHLLSLHAIAVAPFSTGLGNEHPLENGFAFLNPYGLPYLPGSGVKGVLRQAARELADQRWGDDLGWTDDAITALFGKVSSNGETEHQRGALMFWDVIPQIEGDSLQVEIMTPHLSHYLQAGESPHESGQPNPINFLSVPPGSQFAFHVKCDVPFLDRLAPDLARDKRWQQLLGAALVHAFKWLGFGAKTAVGYGAMREDPSIAARRARDAEAERKRLVAQAAEAKRLEALAAMSPTERTMREFLYARIDKNQSELAALTGALKRGQWDGDTKLAIAQHVKALMHQAGKWKERSEKKNPQKDHDHQDTLLVMKWLAGQ